MEKALVEAFSVITNLRMELFEALPRPRPAHLVLHGGPVHVLDDELSGEAAGAVDDEVVLGHGGRGISV